LTDLDDIPPVPRPGARRAAGDPWARRAALAILAILFVRLVSLWFNTTELFFDEAQYWVWAKEPALGYFSKPPMLAWIIGAVTSVCGDGAFCIRLFSPFMHAGTAVLVYLIAARLFDTRTGFWAALIYLTLPAVSLSATLASTDVPLLFFWAAALLIFLHFEARPTVAAAIGLGVAIGAGMLSKYAMVYFLPCVLLYSFAVRERPHVLARPLFWLAMAVAALVFAPNVVWNLQNAFATVGHTGENIGWDGRLHFASLAEFFGSQFGVFGPVLFAIYLVAIFRLVREGMNRAQLFLLCFSVPVLAIILVQALMSKAYANWAALTYVAATVLVADLMVNRIPFWWNRLSLGLHFFAFAVVAVSVTFSRPGQLPLPPESQPFNRMHGSTEIAGALKAQAASGGYAVVMVDNRRMAALMAYYLRDLSVPIVTWRRENAPNDHFEMTRAYQDKPSEPVLYVTNRRNPHEIVSAFGDAELLGDYSPGVGEIEKVWFYALRGYAGPAASR